MRNKLIKVWMALILAGLAIPVCLSLSATALFAADSIQNEDQLPQAGNFAPGQLEAHYLKHGDQLGYNTQEQYLQGARALLNAPQGNDVLQKIRLNGDVERYRISSGEFAVMTKSGRIRTYFKTDYSYWTRQ